MNQLQDFWSFWEVEIRDRSLATAEVLSGGHLERATFNERTASSTFPAAIDANPALSWRLSSTSIFKSSNGGINLRHKCLGSNGYGLHTIKHSPWRFLFSRTHLS